ADIPRITRLLAGSGAAVAAAGYHWNLPATEAAIAAGVHLTDLGGNNEVVDRQSALDGEARARGVTIIPNSGLAPGLINILAVEGMRHFERVDSIRLRVGGLPLRPRPPLNYQLTFSAEGLINEYVEKAVVLRDGEIREVESMTELEEIVFPPPFGTLEAFATSGGLSALPRLLRTKVRDLDYKTIRYGGHCAKMRTLLELGFASTEPLPGAAAPRTHREFFAEFLRRRLDFGGPDVVLLRAELRGVAGDLCRRLVYECVDYYDEATKLTAMMRTTAFPASITARMLARGEIAPRGVRMPEECVPGGPLIRELALRGIHISDAMTDSGE
ncbi:MAG: saccharopine dehydrogenase C-terminal domain-containing protein, partial [Bacteroidota bacterium]